MKFPNLEDTLPHSHLKGRALKIFVPFLAFVCAAGCAGSGAAPAVNPFAGTWSGTWTSVPTNNGTSSITIANSGKFTGQVQTAGQSNPGAVTGTIHSNGTSTITVTYPNVPSYTLSGQFTQVAQGQITGSVTGTANGNAISDTFTFTEQ